MTLSVIDVVLSPTVLSVYFLILSSLFRGGAWPLRPHSGCVTAIRKCETK